MPDQESYIQSLFADRIGGSRFGKDTTIYKFEKIKRAKRAALDANPGKELFDMGVGEPDEMAFPEAVKTLQQEAAKPENRGYSDNGIDEFKQAAVEYMENVFGVKGLDSSKHLNHTIGAKPRFGSHSTNFRKPGRRYFDDSTRLSGYGDSYRVFRRRICQSSIRRI